MNVKVALMLFLLSFAISTATLTVAFNTLAAMVFSVTETVNLNTDVDPMGDPVDGPWGPGSLVIYKNIKTN